jgi:hypothetical protein
MSPSAAGTVGIISISYKRKQWEPPIKSRGKGGKRTNKGLVRHEPEEQGEMPQHKHCPLAKHREDRNPK